jgi:glycosyltransferase EpsD
MLKEQGYEIHTAAAGENQIPSVDRHFDIGFTRNPYSYSNYLAYRKLKRILREEEYTFVHCHTPAASVITRLAGREARKKGTVIIYTAHGFHFYKGGPAKRYILYHGIEKKMAGLTDAILTINGEDYEAARRFNAKNCRVFLTKGVGCNPDKFSPPTGEEKEELRRQFEIPSDAFVLIYPAVLDYEKNHSLLLRVFSQQKEKNPEILLLIPSNR